MAGSGTKTGAGTEGQRPAPEMTVRDRDVERTCKTERGAKDQR